VIASQDQHIVRIVVADNVEVLEDGVGGALVPIDFDALLRRQQFDELVELAAQKTPAALDVLDQAMRLVLRDDANTADAGVETVGQREIDDAELAAEWHGRLGAPVGQLVQPAAPPAGEDEGNCIFCQ